MQKDNLKNETPTDANNVLPAVFSWATFKKKNPDIPIYSYTDGTLGIKYTLFIVVIFRVSRQPINDKIFRLLINAMWYSKRIGFIYCNLPIT